MNINKLRVGITIRVEGKEETLTKELMVYILERSIAFCDPIRITKERLIKNGFKKIAIPELDKNCFVKEYDGIKIILSGIGFWDLHTIYDPVNHSNKINFITMNQGLTYLHDLQNAWLVITGQDLCLT